MSKHLILPFHNWFGQLSFYNKVNRINNINTMITNKPFFGLRVAKKSQRISPQK